ncbi:MAG: hypothetical protein R3F43_15750 [bacterium]
MAGRGCGPAWGASSARWVRAQAAAGRLPRRCGSTPIRLILDGVEPTRASFPHRPAFYAIAGHETTGPSLAWPLWELAGRTEEARSWWRAPPSGEDQGGRRAAARRLPRPAGAWRPSTRRCACTPMDLPVRVATEATTFPPDAETGHRGYCSRWRPRVIAAVQAIHLDPARFEDPGAVPARAIPGRRPGPSHAGRARAAGLGARAAAPGRPGSAASFGAGPGHCAAGTRAAGRPLWSSTACCPPGASSGPAPGRAPDRLIATRA